MLIRPVRGIVPTVHPDAWLAENVSVIGDVKIDAKATIWYNVVLRGDVHSIRIGRETNVQDGTVVHGTYGKFGTTLGDRVTVGHMVMLHGCQIGDGTLVGMGSIIMDGCEIGEHCLIGAGTLLTEGTIIPSRSLVVGRPGKVKRSLTDEEVALLEKSADNYLFYREWYR